MTTYTHDEALDRRMLDIDWLEFRNRNDDGSVTLLGHVGDGYQSLPTVELRRCVDNRGETWESLGEHPAACGAHYSDSRSSTSGWYLLVTVPAGLLSRRHLYQEENKQIIDEALADIS